MISATDRPSLEDAFHELRGPLEGVHRDSLVVSMEHGQEVRKANPIVEETHPVCHRTPRPEEPGVSGGGHAYEDANSIGEFSAHGRRWLCEIDRFNGPTMSFHNSFCDW